jgi:hypothetical protein
MPALREVYLNAQEMAICNMMSNGRITTLEERGQENNNFTSHDTPTKEAISFRGEMGFCKMFGTFFHTELKADKDVAGKRGDTTLGGFWVDVKTLTKYYVNKRLICPTTKDPEQYLCDVFALVYVVDNLVQFYGFFEKDKLLVPERIHGPECHPPDNSQCWIPYEGWVADEYELYPTLEEILCNYAPRQCPILSGS